MELDNKVIEALKRMNAACVFQGDEQTMLSVGVTMQREVTAGNIYEPYIIEVIYGCKYIEDKIGLHNLFTDDLLTVYRLVDLPNRIAVLPKEKNNTSMSLCLNAVIEVNTILTWVNKYLNNEVMIRQTDNGNLQLKYLHHGNKDLTIEIGKSLSICVLCGDYAVDDWDELNKVMTAIKNFLDIEKKHKLIHLVKHDAYVLIDISKPALIEITVKKGYAGLAIGAKGSNINTVKRNFGIPNKLVIKERA